MNILVAGDFAPRHRIVSQIESGDFSCLEQMKPIIQSADYAIVNFESPVVSRVTKSIDKTGPNLKCDQKAMECIAHAGFRCVTLANNHFRDYGQIGIEDTIDACKKYKIEYVGGGKTQSEAEQILYKNINEQTLAVINCCEHEWSIATAEYGGSNPLDIVSICHAIKSAKQKADYILVIVHGGTEGYNLPTPRMKKTYRFFVEQGADAVVNHHQHCFSGYEVYRGKPIFYGLGNLCFDTASAFRNDLWIHGFMVQLQFSETTVLKIIPYIQCDDTHPAVIMLDDTDSFFTSIEQLNTIIADDCQLLRNFEKMSTAGRSYYRGILAPYSTNLLFKLYCKGLLPSFASHKRKRLLLSYVQCESHRDILLKGLLN